MSETSAKSAGEIQAELQAIARDLRNADHLGSETRQGLAELIEELSEAVDSGSASSVMPTI